MRYKSCDCFFAPLIICPCRFNPVNPSESIHHLGHSVAMPGQPRAKNRHQQTENCYFCHQNFEGITQDC